MKMDIKCDSRQENTKHKWIKKFFDMQTDPTNVTLTAHYVLRVNNKFETFRVPGIPLLVSQSLSRRPPSPAVASGRGRAAPVQWPPCPRNEHQTAATTEDSEAAGSAHDSHMT